MKIKPFATEQFFSLYEFNARYPLSTSDCETMSIEELLDLAGVSSEEFLATRLNYTESEGDPELREQIASEYENATGDNVVYLGAPVEGIFIAMNALLNPGDEVIAMRPAYDALLNVVEQTAGEFVPWDLSAGGESWKLDFELLRTKISSRTKMLVVNFPHNPTGFLPTHQQFGQLVEWCRENDVWLFCDEMYRGLEIDTARKLPSAADVYEKAISLSGLSKTFGLPGLRSGWLVLQNREAREEVINWKHYTTICPSASSERLALAAMKVREQLAESSRTTVRKNLAIAESFFSRHDYLFKWRAPIAGSVALVGVTRELTGDSPVFDYCHQLAREHGVLLLPGECLGADYLLSEQSSAGLTGFVRFGFGRANFAESIQEYDKLLTRKFV